MLKKQRTNVYDFNFHLVWVTKYRKPIFTSDGLASDMKKILKNISKENGVEIQKMEVMPDHIHLLISFPPNKTPSSVVKSFKGTSARLWFKKHPETKKKLWGGHLWSSSFFMCTLGNISKDVVEQYIKNQLKEYNNGRPRR